jgi:hypothetical protein
MPAGKMWLGLVALAFGCASGCQTTPAVTVVRSSTSDKAADVRGDPLKLKRGPQEPFAGSRGGYFAIRSLEDWQRAWPADKSPPMPIDPSEQMLLFAVADTAKTSAIRIQRAVETAEAIYVYVRETRVGPSCPSMGAERAYDAVATTRIDKPLKFLVTDEPGESCGDPPATAVQCRAKNQQSWATSLQAQPGDTIECAMTATERGRFEIIDKVLSIDLPPGSSSKLAFTNGPLRGEFGVDVYGGYAVNAEAVDASGRHTRSTAKIDVRPPKTKDVLVQLVWTGFDAAQSSETFPRVNLRVAEEGPKGQRCSAEIPIPGLCEVKTRGAYTYMRIPEGKRSLPVSVQYLGERAEKGPGPCVHVWFDGARTAETCDRKHRAADEIWQVGTLDTTTGKLADRP